MMRIGSCLVLVGMVACSSGPAREETDGGGIDVASGGGPCDDYAAAVCSGACACEASCGVYYPTMSSQAFGSLATCEGAFRKHCGETQLDLATCMTDLQTAKCKSPDFGSGLGLPAACF